jgi:hypothetical protein
MTLKLDHPELAELAREKSVRGCVAKLVLQKAVAADEEQKDLLCDALEMLLQCFEGRESQKT